MWKALTHALLLPFHPTDRRLPWMWLGVPGTLGSCHLCSTSVPRLESLQGAQFRGRELDFPLHLVRFPLPLFPSCWGHLNLWDLWTVVWIFRNKTGTMRHSHRALSSKSLSLCLSVCLIYFYLSIYPSIYLSICDIRDWTRGLVPVKQLSTTRLSHCLFCVYKPRFKNQYSAQLSVQSSIARR